MSLSKLSLADKPEKKFVIKHVFKDVNDFSRWPRHLPLEGKSEKHFNVKWKISLTWDPVNWRVEPKLRCKANFGGNCGAKVSISTFINGKAQKDCQHHFCGDAKCCNEVVAVFDIYGEKMKNGFGRGELEVECHVTIDAIVEFKFDLRSFDDESAKKYSDVVLKIGDRKFHVMKMYLASQCSYFEALFLGNFSEYGKSEIELKDIDPQDFQNFLELLHGEAAVGRHTYDGILKLADFFDSKTAIHHCERWLINETKFSKEKKLEAANKYNLEELKGRLTQNWDIADSRHNKNMWD